MSVMPTMLTYSDLAALPDDGLRHELLNGAYFVTPAPGYLHQSVVMRLGALLLPLTDAAGLVLLGAPFDVVLSEHTVVEPDLLVAHRDQVTAKNLSGAPLLAVEVRSRSTAAVDALVKRELYERAGVHSYWLVDPEAASVIVLEFAQGRYLEVGRAAAGESIDVASPVAVRLAPSDWVR